MAEYLVEHARKFVWCTPDQDLQVILEPAKLTGKLGRLDTTRLLWDDIPLPTVGDRYHLYQIGQVHPELLGLLPQKMVWRTVKDNMREMNLFCDVYTITGRHLPRFECWFLVTEDKNVVLAIKDQTLIANLDEEKIFVRLYSNAYFQSIRSRGEEQAIFCEGQRYKDLNQMLFMQRRYMEYKAKHGYCQAFINGWAVDNFITPNLTLGDIVEYVYDSTVKLIVDFPMAKLEVFHSDLDKKEKYLLHYVPQPIKMIDYRDDIDFYLLNTQAGGGKYTATYYHHNAKDSIRMVTHKDYSLPVEYVNALRDDSGLFKKADTATIRMIVRNSGYQRPLVPEKHRIHELYKLPEPDLLMAMLGIDANVDVWKAASLELSQYPEIMRGWVPENNSGGITLPMVTKAYGYNASAMLLGDTPQRVKVIPGRNYVDLPAGLIERCTVYEYNAAGHLIGIYPHAYNPTYKPRNALCTMIEAISGKGGLAAPITYNQPKQTLNPKVNYRMYKTRIWRGVVQDDEWQDVTNSNAYAVVNNQLTWFDDPQGYTAVVADDGFITYSTTVGLSDGVIRFSIVGEQNRYGQTISGPLVIPGGQLDLWLNGRPLIEGLDYKVDWPTVVLSNKMFLVNQPANQRVTVRMTGFCTKDMKLRPAAEHGFIEWGQLSRNNRFNVRDDKVIRVVVNGTLRARDELVFAEDDNGISVESVRNGSPYQIQNMVIPLRDFTSETTYDMLEEALVIDKQVEDYLNLRLPEKPKTVPSPFPEFYQVYSPFTCKIMNDMLSGIIDMEPWTGQYSDMAVLAAFESYRWLLPYDPAYYGVNENYVTVHPHELNVVVTLNIYQYMLLERVIKVFLDNKVDINRFIKIMDGYVK